MRDDIADIYRVLVAGFDGIEVKGKKTAYTAMNGNMFSFVDGDGLMCVRLSKKDKQAFEAAQGTGDVVQYGAVMKGYVPVPEAMLNDATALREWFGKAVDNAKSLKPKPTKRS